MKNQKKSNQSSSPPKKTQKSKNKKSSKIPKWALKFKTKGTEIRSINGHLYLYQITSKRSKEKGGRPVKITLGCIGRVTKNGIIKSKRRKLEEALQHISVYEYGFSQWLFQQNTDLLQALQATFPNEWKYLLLCTYMRLLHQAPMKNYPLHYAFTYLKHLLSMSTITPQKCSQMLEQVGIQRKKIIEFFQKLMTDTSKHLLIDITHVFSQSQQLGLNQKGYNAQWEFRPQINFLCLYGYEQQMPLYYRVLSGDISDVKTLTNAIAESGVKQCVVIGDKGFNSEENRKYLEEQGLYYVMPLKRDSSLIEEERLRKSDKREWTGFFIYQDRPIWYYRYRKDNRWIFVFFDEHLQAEEDRDYLLRIEKQYEGYSIENYHSIQHRFGTLAIITNVEEEDGKKIYEMYKSRHAIEQVYDVFKNVLEADRMYVRDKETLEGWMFVHYLAMVYWYRIQRKLKEKKMESRYSPKDIIEMLSRIQSIQIGEEWKRAEYPRKYREILEKLEMCIV